MPASVGDAVLARAARLSIEARAVLDVAAVIGASVDPNLLLSVAGPVLDEADECIARGLLRSTGDGLAFRHELTRDAILAAIAPPRRRLLHGRILASMREAPPGEHDLARLAHHAEAAGDREAVLELAIAAAEQATALHAHREAAAQYARALRFAGQLPAAERARLWQKRAMACYFNDQGEEAIAACQAAIEIWRSSATPSRKARTCAGFRTSPGSRDAALKLSRLRLPPWRSWNPSIPDRNWRWPSAIWPNCECSATTSMRRSGGVTGLSPSPSSSVRPKPSSTR